MTVVCSYVFLCVLMLVCPTCSKHGFLDVPSRTRHFHLQDVRGSMQNVRHSRAMKYHSRRQSSRSRWLIHPDWVKNSCALAPSPKRKRKDEVGWNFLTILSLRCFNLFPATHWFAHTQTTHPNNMIYLSPEDEWKHKLYAVILTLSFQDLGFLI